MHYTINTQKNITIPRSSSCPLRIALVNVVVNLEVRQAQAKTRMARLGNSSNLHRNYHKKRTAERFTVTGQCTMPTNLKRTPRGRFSNDLIWFVSRFAH